MSTQNLPESKAEQRSKPCDPYPSTSTSTKWATPEDLWQDLRMKENLRRNTKRSYYNGQSLLNNLVRNREVALDRCKNYEKTNDSIKDEIEYLKEKTGARSIDWSMSWDKIYFLRSIKNLQLLLKQSDAKSQRIITNALNGHSLT